MKGIPPCFMMAFSTRVIQIIFDKLKNWRWWWTGPTCHLHQTVVNIYFIQQYYGLKHSCPIICLYINILQPSAAIWQYISRSTLAQVITCRLTAPSPCLSKRWLLINEVPWHSKYSTYTIIWSDSLSDAYMRQWTVSSLVQVTAYRWYGAMFLPEPQQQYGQLVSEEQTSVGFLSK